MLCMPLSPAENETGVTVYPAPKGAPVTGKFIVKVNGQQLDVYNHRKGKDISFATCDIRGEVSVTVQAAFMKENARCRFSVHPLSRGILPVSAGNMCEFKVSKPCSVTVLINGDFGKNILHLFLNPPAEKPPENAIVFGPGFHNLGYKKPIQLKSGQTLYIAGGAWVVGHVRMRDAKGVENIRITGRGVLAQHNRGGTGIWINNAKGLLIEGIIVTRTQRDWCALVIDCQDVTVRNYKAISSNSAATDGFNPINSRNVTIEDSFFHTQDDCIAMKGMTGGPVSKKIRVDPKTQPPVENILVKGCVFWSDYNNVVCMGAETRAKHYKNIVIEDCDVLYHKNYFRNFGTFSIVALHGTQFRDLVFRDIRVEYTENKLFCFKFGEGLYGPGIPGDQSWPGGIDGVVIEDLSVLHQRGGVRSEFSGYSKNKQIKNVTIKNYRHGKRYIADKESMGLACNEYVKNVVFKVSESARVDVEPCPKICHKPDPAKGPLWFKFCAGLRDGVKGGDGVELQIEAYENGNRRKSRLLFRESIKKLGWNDYAVNLSEFKGRKVVLRFVVSPKLNTKYDWFCFGQPEVVDVRESKMPRELMGLEELTEGIQKGILAYPYGDPQPLANGASVDVQAGEEKKKWLKSGAVSKPGIFIHPAWKGNHSEPAFFEFNIDLNERVKGKE